MASVQSYNVPRFIIKFGRMSSAITLKMTSGEMVSIGQRNN